MNSATGIKKWMVIMAFAMVYIVWGSTYLVILIAMKDIPPFIMSGLRFLAAGILLYAWCIWQKEPRPSLRSMKINTVCGILMLSGGTVCVAWAEQFVPSSLAAIIVTSLPFWFVMLDKKQWRFYFSNKPLIFGLLLGFAGVAILMGFDKPVHPFADPSRKQEIIAILVIVAGGIAWASGSLYSKYRQTGSSLLVNGALQLLLGGIFTLMVSLIAGEWNSFSFRQVQHDAWMALAYLIIFGSLITYVCYLWLLKVRPPALVSTYVYVNPMVALVLGVIFLNEHITWIQVLSLAVILGGVLLVNAVRFKTT